MQYDVLIVGGGISGITSAAYLVKKGYHVLICEAQSKLGGLIGTFEKDGFKFDQGIRAFENSGALKPMLNSFDIDLELLPNPVTIGLEDTFIKVSDEDFLVNYENLLIKYFPHEEININKIIIKIGEVMSLFDVLYEIDNPILLEGNPTLSYAFKTLIPWLLRFRKSIKKAEEFQVGVKEFLLKYTTNTSLIDMICQHFFEKTPAFFALSYYGFYKEYKYPKGGTSTLIKPLEEYLVQKGVKILLNTKVTSVNSDKNIAFINNKEEISYKRIIWACDQKSLYNSLENLDNDEVKKQKLLVNTSKGSDSVLTLNLGLNIDSESLLSQIGPHSFYTAYKDGISQLGHWQDSPDIISWVKDFLRFATYELSSPSARDASLAPKGQTNLIISTLFDYDLTNHFKTLKKLDEFKDIVYTVVIELLEKTILKDLSKYIIYKNISTPLTIESFTSNTEGSITGWSYKNKKMPSINEFSKIRSSIYTNINNLYQVGQWSFSPAGMPTGILTAKLAADKINKELKRKK